MSPSVRVQKISKSFGNFAAVSDVSIDIAAGSIHSIIGPNGAGKTTLFNCLSGELRPDKGSVFVGRDDISRLPSHKRVAVGVGRSFQITSLFPDLTVEENLLIAAQGKSGNRALALWRGSNVDQAAIQVIEEVLQKVGMKAERETKACELSHAQQRRLEVGMALASKPSVLLLDEPTSGMGVDDVPEMTGLIASLRGTHTVILIEHNMGIVMRLSDAVTVLAQGKVVCTGTPSVVEADPRVRTVYLGEVDAEAEQS